MRIKLSIALAALGLPALALAQAAPPAVSMDHSPMAREGGMMQGGCTMMQRMAALDQRLKQLEQRDGAAAPAPPATTR